MNVGATMQTNEETCRARGLGTKWGVERVIRGAGHV